LVLGRQNAVVSGEWCYNGGSAAVYEVIVNLNRGLNTIDLTPVSGSDAPFIDKIKLEKAPLINVGLEAELAEIVGATTIVACGTASNGGLVNPLASASNGIRYNNLLSAESKTYDVDISYITKVTRNLKISVNGQPYVFYSFAASGNWCFEGGAPKIKTIQLTLAQGINTIEIRSTGTDAPFIDKIAIKEQATLTSQTVEAATQSGLVADKELTLQNRDNVSIYPNPVRAGAPCSIVLNTQFVDGSEIWMNITDMMGRTVYTRKLSQRKFELKLNKGLSKGLYIVNIMQGQNRITKKLVVQ